MEINIDRIKSRFDGKILKEDIVKVYYDFKRIDDVLKLVASHFQKSIRGQHYCFFERQTG